MNSEKKKQNFHDIMSEILAQRLTCITDKKKSINKETCLEIYQIIFNVLQDIFTNAKTLLTNEAANYIAQQYYDGILINGCEDQLDPNIFTTRAKLENIKTQELLLMSMMLSGCPFAIPVIHEIKRRN